MKKESSKVLGIILLSIVLISLVANFVVAASFWDSIAGRFSSGSGEDVQLYISRFLLILLVILLVYSITSFLPFIPKDKGYINWGISIIIGVLSFMFVTTEDIRYILINYEALGIMLTTIVPLIILITFGYKLREQNPGMAAVVNKVLYIGFALYLVVRFFTLDPGELKNSTLQYVYPATFFAVLIWLIVEKWVAKTAKHAQTGSDIENFADKQRRTNAVENVRSASTK